MIDNFVTLLFYRCGAQYTSKLEGMMTDMERATEINKDFQDWLTHAYNGTKPVETHVISIQWILDINYLKVRVLGKAHWPGFKNLGLSLPKELLDSQTIFIDFYNKTNNFRTLEFIYPLCNVVVEANFDNCKCEITMSLLQFTILSFFNRTKSATFKELMAELNFDEETLKKNLHSLVFEYFVLIWNNLFLVL